MYPVSKDDQQTEITDNGWEWDGLNWQWTYQSEPPVPALPVESYTGQRQAVNIKWKAVEQLNYYRGVANSLLVKVLQVEDIDLYQSILKDSETLSKILSEEIVSGASAINDVYISNIFPNSSGDVQLDRKKGTRYILIVAGYYSGDVDTVAIVPIPAVPPRHGDCQPNPVVPLFYKEIEPQPSYEVGELFIDIVLDASEIKSVGVVVK